MNGQPQFVRWFDTLSVDDVPIVGGKNAFLSEMYRELTRKGVKIPNGFAATADAFRYVIETAGVLPQMRDLDVDLDKDNLNDFARRGRAPPELVYHAPLPGNRQDSVGAPSFPPPMHGSYWRSVGLYTTFRSEVHFYNFMSI